ncbi:hypothetical protein QH494_14505 [Sphingomonas sp. AR_OL41]|uniref:ArnT family glycosyltransferase n=1 Tax=Sphingomonas sp. AR_OL41 TaxID=3042729 RepID=UPI002480F71C|nr:hypothetical protein [Sphingomonas sp. AR_OL41]MDH7973398.1 hypothetical protein [Sphingomonas sp. AR_OL41]
MRRADLSSETIVAALLLAMALAVRAVDFGNPVIHVDEQYYLLVGDRLLHGALPYVDIWDRKPIGLFAIFAAIRLLPGDGVLAYQLIATLFAAATAWLVQHGARRLGATPRAALVAGAAYLIWLPLLSGRGGQSPVFYNLFVTGAAILMLRLPALAARQATRAIVINGAVACLLAGLAIQTKYTPAIEGAFFGLAHLYYLHRAGARWPVMTAGAALWLSLGLAPTALIILLYWAHGPAAFHAFWFANFESIFLRSRYAYPLDLIARRLLGTSALLLPLTLCAALAWRRRDERRMLAFGWLGAAIAGYLALGTFFDHYALPLVAPLALLAAVTFARHGRAIVATLALGLILLVVRTAIRHSDAAGAYRLAAIVAANSGGECPYVFTGDAVTYLLARACLPTAYAFPSTLAYAPEQGASGIDEASEVRRILAHRPPVIVRGSRPLAEWNDASRALVDAALTRDYRPVFNTARDDYRLIVWLRRDRPFASPRP